MPAPTTAEELIDLAKKSGVVEEKRLEAVLAKLRAAGTMPVEPGKLAGILVRDGILTHFQAEQFLQGRWRRFTIGKYKVMEKLGSGGMGNVYLCEHKFMRRRAAVKVLPAAKAEDPSSLERFYREARAVAALDHPNIVRAYDIDQDDKLHFLVMEFVDGASLQEIVKKFGPMDMTRAAHYIRQAAVGLQHAHQAAGLVHRDIKPGNVLVDRSGIVKVLDMGLARFFHDEEDVLTKKFDETVLGTADYLAPEQALDSHGVDIRADIYSLGATFYFMLTGSTPFSEGTVAQKLIWHQTRQPKAVRTIRPEVPAELAAVVEKMMAKDPAQRYQTPGEVVEALTPFTQQPIPPPPDKEMPRLSPAAMGSMSEITIGSGHHRLPPSSPRSVTPPPTPVPPRPATSAPLPQRPQEPGYSPPKAQAASPPSHPTQTEPGSVDSGSGNVGLAVASPAQEENGGVPWESYTSDTDNPTARVDTVVQSLQKRTTTLERLKEHPYFWYFVAGGVFLLISTIGILWALIHGSSESKAPPTSRLIPRTIYVTDSKEGKDEFPTIHDALRRVRPGDRIIVRKDVHEEHLQIEDRRWTKSVTIEGQAPDGGRVIWRLPSNSKEKVLLELHNTEGLTVKGFTLDGEGRLDDLAVLFGQCPDLILEDIHFQGFKRSAVDILHCAGSTEQPVILKGLRAIVGTKAEAALLFGFRESIVKPRGNEHIRVSDCILAGPYQTAVELIGPEQDIEFRSNRIFNAENGFVYKPGKTSLPLQMAVVSNTFCRLQAGLTFESLPQSSNPNQESRVIVEKNLFAQTDLITKTSTTSVTGPAKIGNGSQAGADQLVRSSGNVRDAASQEGNINLKVTQVAFPPLPQDVNNLQRFLRYPKDSPLVQHGSPGVQPEE
jgi:serine/threonine protein kinase